MYAIRSYYGFPEASLQSVPGENIYIIKVSAKGGGERMVGEKVETVLGQGFPSNPQTVESA